MPDKFAAAGEQSFGQILVDRRREPPGQLAQEFIRGCCCVDACTPSEEIGAG